METYSWINYPALALRTNVNTKDYTTIVYAKRMKVKDLKDYQNDLLVITPEEEAVGYKHVFQTMITKDTVHERIRSPLRMWNVKETFIDNNAAKLLNRIHSYYNA